MLWYSTGTIEGGKNFFLSKWNLNVIDEFEKNCIFSQSLHQDLCQKINKSFSIYFSVPFIPDIFNEEDIDVAIHEILFDKDLDKSGIDIETYESKD